MMGSLPHNGDAGVTPASQGTDCTDSPHGICLMTLEFSLNHDTPASATTDCIVVGSFTDKSLTPAG